MHLPLAGDVTSDHHLLQQDGVVALKGLEDVVVTAPRAKTVHRCVSMPAATLTAYDSAPYLQVGFEFVYLLFDIAAPTAVRPG